MLKVLIFFSETQYYYFYRLLNTKNSQNLGKKIIKKIFFEIFYANLVRKTWREKLIFVFEKKRDGVNLWLVIDFAQYILQ